MPHFNYKQEQEEEEKEEEHENGSTKPPSIYKNKVGKKKARPLSVVGYDDREQRHPPGVDLPEWMPMHEFFMLIVAPAGAGKTTLILNLLLRIYHRYFNRVIVFSPTIHNDQKWKHLTQQKNVLRPNPHRSLWENKVKESTEPAQKEGAPSSGDPTPEEKEWLATQQDTFLIENFKDKKGSKKRLGATQYKLWKQMAQTPYQAMVTGSRMLDTATLLEKKRRTDRLAAMLVKPTPPLLAQQVKQFNQLVSGSSPVAPLLEHYLQKDPRWGAGEALDLALGAHRRHGHRPGSSGSMRGGSSSGPQDGLELDENDNGQTEQDEQGQENETQQKDHKKDHHQVRATDLHEEYSEKTLEEAMTYQDKVIHQLTRLKKPMTCADHLCWVFDDMVGSGLFNQKRNNAFKRLSVRRRHFCSSVIGVVQAYKEFPKTSRTNCNVYILFRIDSEEELESIYKDFPCGLIWPHWKRVYDYCTAEPYSFMMINTQVKDPQFKLVKNFDEPLFIPLHRQEQQVWMNNFPE